MLFTAISATTFRSRVILGQTAETRTLEFKSEYRWQPAKYGAGTAGQAEELGRDVAQFANTEGGTLLVGINERDASGGRKVADTIAPVDAIDGFKQWAEQAIRNHLTPATFSRSFDVIVTDSGPVLAINVPPSLHLVALWVSEGKKGIEYLYRTEHGKEWMNPDEVERHIMNGSRAIDLELARVVNEVGARGSNIPVTLTPPLHTGGGAGLGRAQPVLDQHEVLVRRSACTDREVELSINVNGAQVGSVRIPHGLVRCAWRTSDTRVGLCLDVAVVLRGGSAIRLEPVPGVL